MEKLVFNPLINLSPREKVTRQQARVVWFTGLSGAGKTTLARALEQVLLAQGFHCVVLDGDDLRRTISHKLGFSQEDRHENIRRVAEVARLFQQNGVVTIVATISPYQELRELARRIVGEADFIEVYISAPLQVCEARDVKGLYRQARQNQLNAFTGVQDTYVPPSLPDLCVQTDTCTVAQAVQQLAASLYPRLLPPAA